MQPIQEIRSTVAEVSRVYPNFARELQKNGFTSQIILVSDKTAAEAWEFAGGVKFIIGSRSLFERWLATKV